MNKLIEPANAPVETNGIDLPCLSCDGYVNGESIPTCSSYDCLGGCNQICDGCIGNCIDSCNGCSGFCREFIF